LSGVTKKKREGRIDPYQFFANHQSVMLISSCIIINASWMHTMHLSRLSTQLSSSTQTVWVEELWMSQLPFWVIYSSHPHPHTPASFPPLRILFAADPIQARKNSCVKKKKTGAWKHDNTTGHILFSTKKQISFGKKFWLPFSWDTLRILLFSIDSCLNVL